MEFSRNSIKSFFTEYWKYLALSTACKLNIFDNLENEKSVSQLSNELSLSKDKLYLLLEYLTHQGFLSKNGNNYINSDQSNILLENNPNSLKYACILWSDEHLTAWQNLDYSIKSGKSPFEKIYGLPFFDYLERDEKKLHIYHKAMYEYALDDYSNLPKIIDFSKYNSVMDVGGGYGAVLKIISNIYPNISYYLLDLDSVIQKVELSNVKVIGGNFFKKIPNVSDAIILSRILHDWDDNHAKVILKNCYEALSKNGELILIENCVDLVDTDFSLLSLNMTVVCESFERSSKEYVNLVQESGFKLIGKKKLNELQNILSFKKI